MSKQVYFGGLLLVFTFVTFSSQATESDFDEVCLHFQALQAVLNVDAWTHQQRNDFIMNKITNNLPATSNARAAWEAIASATPEQRYMLFKSSAESVLNARWQCPAMKTLAPKTGEF